MVWFKRSKKDQEVVPERKPDISEPVIAIIDKLKNNHYSFDFSSSDGLVECKDTNTDLKITVYTSVFIARVVVTNPCFGMTADEQNAIANAVLEAMKKQLKDQQQKARQELIEKYCK